MRRRWISSERRLKHKRRGEEGGEGDILCLWTSRAWNVIEECVYMYL
jgi:hypothetical protein